MTQLDTNHRKPWAATEFTAAEKAVMQIEEALEKLNPGIFFETMEAICPHLKEVDALSPADLEAGCRIIAMNESIPETVREIAQKMAGIAPGLHKDEAEWKSQRDRFMKWAENGRVEKAETALEIFQFIYLLMKNQQGPTKTTTAKATREALTETIAGMGSKEPDEDTKAQHLQRAREQLKNELTDELNGIMGQLNTLHEDQSMAAIRMAARLMDENLRRGTRPHSMLEEGWPGLKHSMTEMTDRESEFGMDMAEFIRRCAENENLGAEDIAQGQRFLENYREIRQTFHRKGEEMRQNLMSLRVRLQEDDGTLLNRGYAEDEVTGIISRLIMELEEIDAKTAHVENRLEETLGRASDQLQQLESANE